METKDLKSALELVDKSLNILLEWVNKQN